MLLSSAAEIDAAMLTDEILSSKLSHSKKKKSILVPSDLETKVAMLSIGLLLTTDRHPGSIYTATLVLVYKMRLTASERVSEAQCKVGQPGTIRLRARL
jgi:hypothetical protein